ncbi:MAG: MarR family transcriptional regulator [Sulfuritalea sp.]|jgi:DNA-binding MarR family transcriptional regulator|nr:MarR family transcriptional regulator [Sulfuritalea sp.]
MSGKEKGGGKVRAGTEYSGHNRFLPYVLNRVTNRLNADFQAALRQRGMTLTHWRVLAFLEETDGLGVSALADYTVTDQSTLSRALQQMERRGLVERRASTADNRFVEVHITALGRTLFAEIIPLALQLRDRALAGLADADRDRLLDLLSHILVNLQR